MIVSRTLIRAAPNARGAKASVAGPPGLNGAGIPSGGIVGQVLGKRSGTDYDGEWQTLSKDLVGLNNVDNTSDATKNLVVATLTNKSISGSTNTISNLTTAMFTAGVVDTDTALAANSDTRIATQKAVKAYADSRIAANDAEVYKGAIDASTNPNYPAADAGHTYRISVAGKIGGASGAVVEAGDRITCNADGTSAGTQAGVGANWDILQTNIDGAVVGPASATSANIATFNGTSGKAIQDSGKSLPAGAIVGTSDAQTLTNKSLTSPAITTPTGIVKGDVGLGNVDNTSDATKNAATVTLTNKTISGASNTLSNIGNSSLTNSSITLNAGTSVGITTPGAMSLGSTYTIGATSDTPRFAGLGLGGAATGANILTVFGGTSGHIDFKVPAAAGTNAITFPAGTTDFSSTGGASQVVKQTSAGGAFTVGQLAFSDLSGSASAAQLPSFGSGDVSFASGGGVGTIANDAVTYAKMQNVSATSRFLGRKTAGAGDPEELTASDAKTILALAVADISGAAPLASPTFTGTPAAPTAAVDTSTTQLATSAFVIGQAASATPLINGTAATGTSTRFARGDHVHQTDTTRAASGANTDITSLGSGNIGVGTTSPTSKLTVSNNAAALPSPPTNTVLHIGGSDSTGSIILSDGFGVPGGLAMRSTMGTAATPTTALISDIVIGALTWYGHNGTAYTSSSRAKIAAAAAEAWTSTANGTYLDFFTTKKTTATSAAQMRLDDAGALTIAKNSATPAGGTAGLGLMLGTTANLGVFFGSGAPTLSAAQGSLYMRTDGSSTSTRMYINTNGSTGWTAVTTAS